MLLFQKKLGENWIKKYEKLVAENEIDKIGKELNNSKFDSNLVNNIM